MSTPAKEIGNQEKSSQEQEQTQQTSQEENQRIEYDPNYVQSLEQRIAEQQIHNRRLESLITETRREREQEVPQQRDLEGDRNRFYQDPIGTLEEQLTTRDNKILKQMQEMLKPIQEVASSFRVDSEYTRIKNQLKHDPVFGKGLQDPDVENIVDSIIKQPGVILSEDTVKSAIAQAFGMKSMGGIGNRNRSQQNERPGTRIDPPTIAPTRTRINAPSERKELTEDDRLAMKYAGLKPGDPEHEKQYWELISDETMVLETHKKK